MALAGGADLVAAIDRQAAGMGQGDGGGEQGGERWKPTQDHGDALPSSQ
jgi:hypothetical protein